jgi:single-strand DNA-binding protein
MNINTITICGNVVRDPELRHTSNGTPTTTFSVAVNRRVYSKNDEPTEAVAFFTVVAWNALAENICESIHKGGRVVVIGRLNQRNWEVEGDQGGRRTVYELVADDIGASFRFATARMTRVSRVPAEELDGSEPISFVVPDSPAGLTSPVLVGEEAF